ncbi:MAG: FHA domain-containing protein [Anaerolineae bacterium]|nr:FHA domain-containing protein [Anaerolineae bacterium]
MEQKGARVVVRLGSQPEEIHALRQTTSVGRDSGNDIVIADYEVSRRHARFLYKEDHYFIEDLGSTNGTFVNGFRLNGPAQLYHGDTIELGQSVRMVFLCELDAVDENTPVTPIPAVVAPTGPTVEPVAAAAVTAVEVESVPAAPPPQSQPEALDIPEFVGDDSAEYFIPDDEPNPLVAPTSSSTKPWGCWRYLVGCGCLLLLVLVGAVLTVWLLDALAPDFLYCGPLRGLWDTLNPALNLFGYENICP